MINKKGLSNIIATIVLTLASIISIGMIYSAVIENLAEKQLSPALSCTELQIKNPIKIITSCYNSDLSKVELNIHRDFSVENLSSLEFVIESEEESSRWLCGELCSSGCLIPNPGQETSYKFDIPTEPTTISIFSNNCFLGSAKIDLC